EQEIEAKPGSVVYVPSNVVHSGKATPEEDVVFFTCKDASHSLHGVKGGVTSATANGFASGDDRAAIWSRGDNIARLIACFSPRAWATIDRKLILVGAAISADSSGGCDETNRFGSGTAVSRIRRRHGLGARQISLAAGEDRRTVCSRRRHRYHRAP